jgi:hypothetical protein
MIKKLLAFTCLTLSISANAALVVNVGGQNYSIDKFFGSVEDNQALIESQIWWDNVSLADDFATATTDLLGLGTPYTGPLFAHDLTLDPGNASWGGLVFSSGWAIPGGGLGGNMSSGYSQEWYYAVASQVPVPAAAWLFGSALLGLGAIKRKRS